MLLKVNLIERPQIHGRISGQILGFSYAHASTRGRHPLPPGEACATESRVAETRAGIGARQARRHIAARSRRSAPCRPRGSFSLRHLVDFGATPDSPRQAADHSVAEAGQIVPPLVARSVRGSRTFAPSTRLRAERLRASDSLPGRSYLGPPGERHASGDRSAIPRTAVFRPGEPGQRLGHRRC